MRNYGEELTYWYFRLNGFFLLENFVIHKREGDLEGIRHRSDADLLAIRFPNVVEVIKDTPLECDGTNLFRRTMFDKNRILGLIIEVKSGENWDRLNVFSEEERMRYALERIGFLTSQQITDLLTSEWRIKNIGEDYQVGKVLVHDLRDIGKEYLRLAVCLKLGTLKAFINQRFRENSIEKYNSRIFFPSSLMQFLAWERYRESYPNE